MRSWTAPRLPALPQAGIVPFVADTISGQLRRSASGASAGLYVCGITPYDATHLGHATTYLAFDLLIRAWLDAGLSVRYVQNVTDIDDPLLERAQATGADWRELAAGQIGLFRSDMEALAIIPPATYRGAIEAIPNVVDAVASLVASGSAYALDAPGGGQDFYADLSRDPDFGSFANLSRDEMLALFAERGGDPGRDGKRDPLDPLLWRAARPGEPSWPGGSLGPGRPGWHIECAVIAQHDLGEPFTVIGGGKDLIFPHHEMSVSHARSLQAPAPRIGLHTGLLAYQGEKMSKSRGNLVFVSALLAGGWDARTIRLALLAHHYSDEVEWLDAGLAQARARLARWSRACALAEAPDAAPLLTALREAMSRDLDSPAALAAVDEWAERALSGQAGQAGAGQLAADACEALLGVRP